MSERDIILDIWFDDRIGLGYEVLGLLKEKNINLVGMEAKVREKMSIKFESASCDIESLIASLKQIEGIKSVTKVDFMPYEQREQQLSTILNSVSEGVIAVNHLGVITHINEKAKEIFYLNNENPVGQKIENVFPNNTPILKTLKTGESYSLHEMKYKKGNKVIHYFTSGVPILNKSGNIIGAVATIKDFKQVEEIISKVDKHSPFSFHEIIFQSPQMRKIIETAKIVSKSTSTILIRGESGTGKELFARAIHTESNRADQPFIIINCAALPESLLESELFGYVEGAFTGAVKGGKRGLFEQANKGTLFLDEVGELSLHMQVRLLRVLQEKTIRRIGSNKEIPIDVRIIAATHRNLEEMVNDGKFREDLYYRLNVVPLFIPPLRDRKEDIPLLVNHLTQKICRKLGKEIVNIDNAGMKFLMEQSWPGNVRQLENILERIINIITRPVITVQDFIEWTNLSDKQSVLNKEDSLLIKINLEQNIPQLKDIVCEVERKVLSQVLKVHKSSRKAGKALGISNTTVINKMRKYGIHSEEKPNEN
ncbi:sigma 54-interacting transcriptional regulator [Calidifontibacillus erzurumensis]|uniref:HTH-type transcriptional regulatory protein TyrR n=1 Tax=Calidifontibacillus erzurumensis TaxID=2741433 RepID=A0A8J8GG78_9BACI|nr:sigma 54-interacting transcriptional regulator [Calidifontibacillus erzurumensis]NSL52556.1 sigma 54-interacting transcriptional regulator [Calidifontibacillus erzurumensis]